MAEINITVSWPRGKAVPDHDQMRAMYDSGIIEWHCPGRHGVVRAVPEDARDNVETFLDYFFGVGCAHWRGADVEFVHMAKVFPPPETPDGWCGTSVLWPDR